MRRFFWKFLIFFLLQNNLDFAESAIPEKSDVDHYIDNISTLAKKYFDNRRLFLKDSERRFIQTYFNSLDILDLFWPREDFNPLPEKWYGYSNIIKRNNKRKAIANFIHRLVSFFTEFNKPFGNILPFKTISDIGMLDKNSPFDKLLAEIAKIVDARKGSSSSNVEDVSLYNLIFLFRLLNTSSNRKDIEEVLECNNALLQDSDTMEELFYLLNSLQEDSDFLLHFVNDIDFLQQCGLHKGEYDCYKFDLLEYNKIERGEWNGFFFNNLKKVKNFNFRNVPVFTDKREYPFLTMGNPFHWFFLILSKMMGEPGILEFVDSWQIDNHLILIPLFVLTCFYKPKNLLISFMLLVFWVSYLRVFFCNIISFVIIHLRLKINAVFLEIIPLLVGASSYILDFFEIVKENYAAVIGILVSVISYSILVLWCIFVQKLYEKRLSKILFSNDILRIRRYVRNMRDFYLKIRDKDENIKSLFIKYLPQCSSLFDIDINENKSLNDEQKELFNLIFTDREIPAGDVPRFYFLFYKYKDLLQKIIVEIQYVGSYVNAMMLVNSGKFCIPKFRYSGDNYIKMQDVVHPYLIDGGVRNSFEIGEKETGIRNMIFSGSNGTGKTTFQFAVVDNVILSQSLGIACCSEYSATVFDKIISMSNAKTDLSEGLSGYTSEVEMVKDCLSYLSENKDKRILLISDEPLSTTDPDFADWIVEKIFRRVFSYPNVTSFVATHFKSPKKIPGRDKHSHAGNFRFKIVDNGTSLENLHLLERGQGDNLGKIIAKQRGLLDLIDINE